MLRQSSEAKAEPLVDYPVLAASNGFIPFRASESARSFPG